LVVFAALMSQVGAQNVFAQGSTPPQAGKATNEIRRADLLLGLTAINNSIRVRSLHELAGSGLYDDTFAKALVRYAQEANNFDAPPVIPIVTAAGARIVPSILEALRQTQPQSQAWDTLMLLIGRMGPNAKEALPELNRMLREDKQGEEHEILIRVVLAAIGSEDTDNQAKLVQWLRTRSKPGQNLLRILALIGAKDWPGINSVDALLPWLGDQPSDESVSAALALASLGTKAAPATTNIQRCLSGVDEHWSTLRIIYGTALARIFPPASADQKEAYYNMLKYLGEAGNHTDWAALSMVAHTLVDSNLVLQTIQLLGDANSTMVQGAIRMLSELGNPSGIASSNMIALLRKTKRGAPFRLEIARALAFVLPFTEIAVLEDLLKTEEDREVRERLEQALVVVSLGNHVSGRSAQAGLGGATDKDLKAILRAFRSLDTDSQARQAIRRQGTNAIPKLVAMMGNEDTELRAGAAQAFSALILESVELSAEQNQACVQALTNALADAQPSVREQVAQALVFFAIKHACPEYAMPALLRSLGDPTMRQTAAEAIGHYGSAAKEAVPTLTKLLTDQNAKVCKSAAEALGNIGPEAKDSVDALLVALHSRSREDLQPNIAQALGQIRGKPDLVIPALVNLFDKDEPESGITSSFCAKAVAEYGKSAIPFLLPLLGSPELGKRYWSSVAFHQMQEPAKEALDSLEKLLKDPDPRIRKIVEVTINRIHEGK
jgi:HEAT repeat protein